MDAVFGAAGTVGDSPTGQADVYSAIRELASVIGTSACFEVGLVLTSEACRSFPVDPLIKIGKKGESVGLLQWRDKTMSKILGTSGPKVATWKGHFNDGKNKARLSYLTWYAVAQSGMLPDGYLELAGCSRPTHTGLKLEYQGTPST